MTMAHEGVFPDSPRLAFQVANWFSGHDACICLSGTGSIWGGIHIIYIDHENEPVIIPHGQNTWHSPQKVG